MQSEEKAPETIPKIIGIEKERIDVTLKITETMVTTSIEITVVVVVLTERVKHSFALRFTISRIDFVLPNLLEFSLIRS